jgi:glutamyl-Q tRNA(Asp) synthetase
MSAPEPQRVFRFAPSPNGFLHLGHARSALLNFDLARACGGRFLLRIEDIDRARARPDYEQAIYEDLTWLGVAWDETPRRQSEHFGDYEAALERLEALGLLYPCFCTRGDIAAAIEGREGWPRDPDGAPLYPRTCRALPAEETRARVCSGARAARRLRVDSAIAQASTLIGWREYGEEAEPRAVRAEPSAWGDAVLSRKDLPTSYHLAVVVDDALQGVTDVVRGRRSDAGDEPAPAVAGAARLSCAGLSSSRAGAGRGRQEAVEERRLDIAARAARAGRHAAEIRAMAGLAPAR